VRSVLVTGFTGGAKAAAWRIVAVLAVLAGLTGAARTADNPFLPARDPAPILAAIDKERPQFVPPIGVTGIGVPHHLLAAELIARGFWAASAGHYSRIILLSPDHFRKVHKAFGTTREDLASVLGTVTVDQGGVGAIAANADLVEVLPSLAREHGVMAIAPFIAKFFPGAKVIPVLGSITADAGEWRQMAEALKPLIDDTTLVVQSTDYSHYRPLQEAMARDQETLAMIAAGDPAGVEPLLQPAHMDSKASQYIQMALQKDVFGSSPMVIGNGNSVEYGTGPQSTTSYVVTAFVKDPAAGAVFDYADQTRVMFGGDVLLGRYLLPALRDPDSWAAIRDSVLAITHGAEMIVNLEGVLLDGPVMGVDFNTHVMVTDDAAPVLAALKVGAASLANNHASDLGVTGRAISVEQLRALDVTPLEHGTLTDFAAFRLLALNFVSGKFVGEALADPDDLDWVCGLAAAPPLVAFVHWGTEYVTEASEKERGIARALARCGVTLIVGAHSHQASPRIAAINGGATQMVYSLGNFLFDQSAPRGSGALLEMRVFPQGTVAARLIPIPNLFDLSRPN
jgi:poly-gamma-glutamate synthesis protein (capsule biosynthesis protein)